MRYRKRPIEVLAVQWFGNGHCPVWAQHITSEHGTYFLINTVEGVMRGEPTDWIIQGINGECYPCKADIFAKTYEGVSDE